MGAVRPPRHLPALAAVLVTTVIAGCGGSSSSGPSRAAYVARADRLCRDTRAQAAPLLRQLVAGATTLDAAGARRLAPLGARVHALARTYVTQLEALPRPQADRATLDRFVTGSRATVDGLGAAAAALSAGNLVQALAQLQAVQDTATEANAAAAAYGLEDCATVLTLG